MPSTIDKLLEEAFTKLNNSKINKTAVIADGSKLPDKYATRLVNQYSAALDAEYDRCYNEINKLDRIGVNIKAQVRGWEKREKLLKPILLDNYLLPQKNPKNSRGIFDLIRPRSMGFMIKGEVFDQNNMPQWWWVNRMKARGEWQLISWVGAFSVHSLVRFIQRTNIRNRQELVDNLRQCWKSVNIRLLLTDTDFSSLCNDINKNELADSQKYNGLIIDDKTEFYAPFSSSNGARFSAVCGVVPYVTYSDDQPSLVPIIKTIIPADWVRDDMKLSHEELSSYLNRYTRKQLLGNLAQTSYRLLSSVTWHE